MKNLITFTAVFVGIALIFLAVVYFITPANHLLHFIPGYDANLTRHHVTHGIASLLLGLGAFAFAWFSMGKKSASKKETQEAADRDTIEGEGK